MKSPGHDHLHATNRFAVIPTQRRLNADPEFTGKGVTIAFLDSGFYPHPDLGPGNRIYAYKDLAAEQVILDANAAESWQWHGTQTTVVAAGSGQLCDGTYRGLAYAAKLVLIKASERGGITEESIARGIEWVIENRDRYDIRVLNISLGGDDDVPCSRSIIDQAAERAIEQGVVIVAAAGNAGANGSHSIPPANSPSVITVGGYTDNNQLTDKGLGLYHSNFGVTADGTVKPEIIAPAMWVAAPILPTTVEYERAEALTQIVAAPDYELGLLLHELRAKARLPEQLESLSPQKIRQYVEENLQKNRIIATHYQHVDGTSFAAPIISSIVAQMIEANPSLTPGAIKNILISTADRITNAPAIRQGYGVANARRAVELAKKEQHAMKVGGYSPPRIANGHLIFVYHDDTAQTVFLTGDFNGWNDRQIQLSRDQQGLWRTEMTTPPAGHYQYKFVVDGSRWLEDPSNGMKLPDNYGGLNSVLVID